MLYFQILDICILQRSIQFNSIIIIIMNQNKSRKKIDKYSIHLDEMIGKGTYGQVYVCEEINNKTLYAMKIVSKTVFDNNPYLQTAMKQQLAIHKSLSHPNIVQFIDVVQTSHNYYIVQELCKGGTLRDMLNAHGKIGQEDAKYCIKSICAGFQQIFQKSIIHRDLKPENIIIHESQLKITDFGFAKVLSSQRQTTQTTIGTPLYMAPQLLKKQKYNSKCDIWSIGVIYYELLFGKHPWKGQNISKLYQNIKNNPIVQFPENVSISETSKSFILQCLQFEQIARLSWIEVYEHELMGNFFNDIAKNLRDRYKSSAKKLDKLKDTVEIQKLIGAFLRLKVAYLNFQHFTKIMTWLIPEVQKNELGIMYELFDKDQNGTIDFQQFLVQLSYCPSNILKLLNNIIMQGYQMSELQNYDNFMNLCDQNKFYDEQLNHKAFGLICNISFED